LNRSSVLFVVRPILQLAVEAISLLTERDHAQLGFARAVPSSAKWVLDLRYFAFSRLQIGNRA
jgi:hypothetical protein